MYKHEARALQLESGDLATLAAAAGNAAAVAVLSAVQNARHAAAVRLLAFISFPHGATKEEIFVFIGELLSDSCRSAMPREC